MKAQTRDYFAEMYIAGLLADDGWDIYFPRRDKGFDMIISRSVDDTTFVRPVQVKGKYPSKEKSTEGLYGYIGKLTAFHDDMVLAIPYFESESINPPVTVAWMPKSAIKPHSRGWRCQSATYAGLIPQARPTFRSYFDREGLEKLRQANAKQSFG